MSSSDGIKEYSLSIFPHIKFPGWSGSDSVQSYIDWMEMQLSEHKSKIMMVALLPLVVVDMLYKRLCDWFRPIITALEGIIKTEEPNESETVINKTEVMITAWKDRPRQGNLSGELSR